MRIVRAGGWVALCAVVVLMGRTLAYALATPSALTDELQQSAGGPRFLVVALVTPVLGLALAAAILWLAALGVRERHFLAKEPGAPPALGVGRAVVRAWAIWLVSLGAFAVLESYLHWRVGLGWHGLHCLVGPVHRDVIPILAMLALVTSAAQAALAHVLRWMRRTLAVLLARARAFAARPPKVVQPLDRAFAEVLLQLKARPRGPPGLVVPVHPAA
jgi:hypothetical protein